MAEETLKETVADDAIIVMGVDCSQGSDDPSRPPIRRGELVWIGPDGKLVTSGDMKALATSRPQATGGRTELDGTVTVKLRQASEVRHRPLFRHGGAPHAGNRKTRRAAAATERRS